MLFVQSSRKKCKNASAASRMQPISTKHAQRQPEQWLSVFGAIYLQGRLATVRLHCFMNYVVDVWGFVVVAVLQSTAWEATLGSSHSTRLSLGLSS